MSQERLLVVSEQPDRLAPLLAALAETRFATVVLSSAEAEQRLGEDDDRFDMLIVAIEPEQLHGFDVVRRFRQRFGNDAPVLALSEAFRRDHIEGMLQSLHVRRMFALDVRPEEFVFWVNHELFPDTRRSRRSPRLPMTVAGCAPEDGAADEWAADEWVSNLSEHGLFLETARSAAVGDELEVAFDLPADDGDGDFGGAVRARCEVMRVEPGGDAVAAGLGLRFIALDEATRRSIRAYVLHHLIDETI